MEMIIYIQAEGALGRRSRFNFQSHRILGSRCGSVVEVVAMTAKPRHLLLIVMGLGAPQVRSRLIKQLLQSPEGGAVAALSAPTLLLVMAVVQG